MTYRSLAGILLISSGCAASHGPASGHRADGLFVVCTEEDADRYHCDPQQDGDGRHDGAGDGDGSMDEGGEGVPDPGDHDGCTDWVGGGPAIVLWPPNHQLHTIGIAECAAIHGECRPMVGAAGGSGRIVAVTSDEPVDVGAGGDGDTEDFDMEIVDGSSVRLRSERQGGADGRVYRIEIAGTEGATEICEVHVPHDMGPYGGAVGGEVSVRIDP